MSIGKTALYLRLSREDGDRDTSESIANQRDYLTAYARENGFSVDAVYTDDGYSGLTFERPDFRRMIEDAERGAIDTIITKDLSRLGRDYILTGHYIERVFPGLGVRYIAVNDSIDSHLGIDDMTPVRSVFNDYYAKDISKKVRSALMAKKKNGAFTGAVPPYGYRKDPEDKNRLLPDERTAPYVRRIYRMFLEGMSVLAIAKQFTEEGVETPAQSQNHSAGQTRFPGVWNDRSVKRILENPVYLGHMAQHKTEKISYKMEKRVTLPRERWIVVENTHEPVICREDFEAVQNSLRVRSYQNGSRNADKTQHLLTGLVFCGDCGAPMATIKEPPGRYYLVCRTWRRYAKLKLCTSHCIREDAVTGAIREQLAALAAQYIDAGVLAGGCGRRSARGHGTEKMMCELENRMRETRRVKLALYKDKAAGVISETDYTAFSEDIAKEQEQIKAQIERAEGNLMRQIKEENALVHVKSLLSFEALDRLILSALVGKIEIKEDKQITITFRFSDPLYG